MYDDDDFPEVTEEYQHEYQSHFGAIEVGAAIAAAGAAFDLAPLRTTGGSVTININTNDGDNEAIPFTPGARSGHNNFVQDWDAYVGQEPLKAQLDVHMTAALRNGTVLDHVLLASGMPGVGKTTLARLIAKEMGAPNIIMLVPPFSKETLFEALMSLKLFDVLFIDEIHKLADQGPRASENLLTALEEGKIYLPSGPVDLASFTLIGATTDADKLPETIIDRFPIKPYFQPYSMPELVRITKNFADYYDIKLLPETMVAIAKACRGTPRIARELVISARDLALFHDRPATPEEVLAFKEVTEDGLTRQHKAYLASMYKFFGRPTKDGKVEFVAGEGSMMSLLRENKKGVARLERYLIEQGLLDKTSRGRILTPRGVARAKTYAEAQGGH